MSDNKKAVQSTFGSAASQYVKSELHAKGEDLKMLVEDLHLQLSGDEHILDIAVGAGHVSNALAPFCKEIVAVDLTKEMLETARTFIAQNGHRNVRFEEGDAESLSLPEESFDVSVCRIAAHHFSHPDQFLESAYRVTKPSGLFYLLDNTAPERQDYDIFYNDIEKKRDDSHYRAWKKSEWVAMTEEAGFTVEKLQRFRKTFLFGDWCDRLHLDKRTKERLEEQFLEASEAMKRKFHVQEKDGALLSFEGESILLRAVKR